MPKYLQNFLFSIKYFLLKRTKELIYIEAPMKIWD